MTGPRFQSERLTVTDWLAGGDQTVTGTTYRDGMAAAKAYAAARGVEGRQGGWIYNAAGNVLCQGWQSYVARLVRQGIIVDLDGERLFTVSNKTTIKGRLVRNVFDGQPVLLVTS